MTPLRDIRLLAFARQRALDGRHVHVMCRNMQIAAELVPATDRLMNPFMGEQRTRYRYHFTDGDGSLELDSIGLGAHWVCGRNLARVTLIPHHSVLKGTQRIKDLWLALVNEVKHFPGVEVVWET